MDGRYDRDYCDKECFANKDNHCLALSVSYRGECAFKRTDITMDKQEKDIDKYGGMTSLWK